MTEKQIRTASGRELDETIATELLGWKYDKSRDSFRWVLPGGDVRARAFPFSEDMNACFHEVIPAMREKGYAFYIADRNDDLVRNTLLMFAGGGEERTVNLTVPFGEEATGICRSALLALIAEENVQV